MTSITEAIQQLDKFSKREGLSEILTGLVSLKKGGEIKDESIELLRKALNTLLSDSNNDKAIEGNVSLSDAAYNTLLVLAEFRSINENRPSNDG